MIINLLFLWSVGQHRKQIQAHDIDHIVLLCCLPGDKGSSRRIAMDRGFDDNIIGNSFIQVSQYLSKRTSNRWVWKGKWLVQRHHVIRVGHSPLLPVTTIAVVVASFQSAYQRQGTWPICKSQNSSLFIANRGQNCFMKQGACVGFDRGSHSKTTSFPDP